MNYACIIYFSEFYKTRFGLKQIILLICIIAIFFLGIFRIVFNGDHAKEPVPITGGNSARIGKNFWFPFFAFDDDSTDPPSSISSSYRPELKEQLLVMFKDLKVHSSVTGRIMLQWRCFLHLIILWGACSPCWM